MEIERSLVSVVQLFIWGALQLLMLFLACAGLVFLGYLIFADELAVSSLSVYECVFFVLLVGVLKRSWMLHRSSGNGFGNYLYSMLFNIAVWGTTAFITWMLIQEHGKVSFNSVLVDVTYLLSFLVAIYVSANLSINVELNPQHVSNNSLKEEDSSGVPSDSLSDQKVETEFKVEGSNA